MTIGSSIQSKSLVFEKYGDPRKVLELVNQKVPTTLDEGQVLVEWLCSPVNPLDINIIQGVYAIKRPVPAIGGSEASGRVVKAHPRSSFRMGDLVVTRSVLATNCWSEYAVAEEEALLKLDPRIDPIDAATFMVNPCTAWLMLKDYVALEKGDYVIQNAANSGVGRNVIQVAHAWGIKTINIVRSRADLEELKNELLGIGGTFVFSEEEWAEKGRKFGKEIDARIRLALNGVGGRSCLAITAALEHGGTVVTYGGMSRKPHEFSTSSLVFNDVRVRGVAVGQWIMKAENQNRANQMFIELQELMAQRKVTAPPMDYHRLKDYKEAIERTMGGRNRKQMIIINEQIKNKL